MGTIKTELLQYKLQQITELKKAAYAAGKSHMYWDKFKRTIERPNQIGLWFEIAICYICGFIWREDGFTFRTKFDAELDAQGVDIRLKHFGRVIDLQLKYGHDNGHAAQTAYTVIWKPGMTPRHLLWQMKFPELFKEFGEKWLKLNPQEYAVVKYVLADVNTMFRTRQSYFEHRRVG